MFLLCCGNLFSQQLLGVLDLKAWSSVCGCYHFLKREGAHSLSLGWWSVIWSQLPAPTELGTAATVYLVVHECFPINICHPLYLRLSWIHFPTLPCSWLSVWLYMFILSASMAKYTQENIDKALTIFKFRAFKTVSCWKTTRTSFLVARQGNFWREGILR